MSYALITGASKGIGKAIAFELAKHNYNILLTARSGGLLQNVSDEIKRTFPVQVNFIEIDLSEPGAAQKLYGWCVENNYAVSVLVNNAGYGLAGSFETHSLKENTNLLQLNIIAPTQLCYLFIKLLKQQPQSYLMNIASTSAYQAVPLLSIYAASKAYLLNFSRALRHELAGTSISVTTISPGPTDTDFVNRAGVTGRALKMAERLNMQPRKVATIAVHAMLNKKNEVVIGFTNRLGVFLSWLLPKNFVERTTEKFYK
jgi:short-subunit dehydrogenase